MSRYRTAQARMLALTLGLVGSTGCFASGQVRYRDSPDLAGCPLVTFRNPQPQDDDLPADLVIAPAPRPRS